MTPLAPSPDSLTFIGTATTVLRLGPFTLLTDPNFLHRGQFAYLGKGIASRRRTEPACSIADLPPLDAILLSHLHGDHWDRVAKRELDRTTPVITTRRAARALGRQGFDKSHGLATWDSHVLVRESAELTITALPARHAPGPARALLPPVMGSLLELRDAAGVLRIYLSGDTLLVKELREIPRRIERPDVAVLHLGGTTLPGGLVVTMDARQGADLIELIDPGVAVPVHHSDYGVFKSPLSDFRAEVTKRGLAPRVRWVEPGGEVALRSPSRDWSAEGRE